MDCPEAADSASRAPRVSALIRVENVETLPFRGPAGLRPPPGLRGFTIAPFSLFVITMAWLQMAKSMSTCKHAPYRTGSNTTMSGSKKAEWDDTMTVPEAGARLGLGRNASYEAAARGDFPTIRFVKLLRVPKIPFKRMLEADEPKKGSHQKCGFKLDRRRQDHSGRDRRGGILLENLD